MLKDKDSFIPASKHPMIHQAVLAKCDALDGVKDGLIQTPTECRFDPKTIEINAGQTVTWTNNDNFTHTVHIDGMDDHKVDRGKSVSIRFPKADTYHYVCTLHSKDMHGTVIVK